MAIAYIWVGRIFSICGEMILPGLLGYWLDTRLETTFLAIGGFLAGMVWGMTHLVVLATYAPKLGAPNDASWIASDDPSSAEHRDDTPNS